MKSQKLKILAEKYDRFGDAIVNRIEYYTTENNSKNVQINLSCINIKKNIAGDYIDIKIIFKEVSLIQFSQLKNQNSTLILNALVKEHEDGFLFDFFPLENENSLTENIESDLKIIAKDFIISEEVLNYFYIKTTNWFSRMFRNKFYWWKYLR